MGMKNVLWNMRNKLAKKIGKRKEKEPNPNSSYEITMRNMSLLTGEEQRWNRYIDLEYTMIWFLAGQPMESFELWIESKLNEVENQLRMAWDDSGDEGFMRTYWYVDGEVIWTDNHYLEVA